MTIISKLPLKQQAEIAYQILQGLNAYDLRIEQAWMNEVERRVKQVDSEEVKMIPGIKPCNASDPSL